MLEAVGGHQAFIPDRMRASAATWERFRKGGFRFFFFSREEPRIHVHVHHSEGEAKFWLEPEIELAHVRGLSPPHFVPA